jgi:hypothetical protein
MPTPKIYRDLASAIESKKKIPLGIALSGLILWALSVAILVSNKHIPILLPLLGISGFIVIWGWGFVCLVFWFGPNTSRINKGLMAKVAKQVSAIPFISTLVAWFASIFLTIWFLSSIFFLSFIYKAIVHAKLN